MVVGQVTGLVAGSIPGGPRGAQSSRWTQRTCCRGSRGSSMHSLLLGSTRPPSLVALEDVVGNQRAIVRVRVRVGPSGPVRGLASRVGPIARSPWRGQAEPNHAVAGGPCRSEARACPAWPGNGSHCSQLAENLSPRQAAAGGAGRKLEGNLERGGGAAACIDDVGPS